MHQIETKELVTLNLDIPEGVKVFLISDTHFGHSNIIKYCNRPFESVDKMNETLIRNWCETITNDDYVIHVGDFVVGVKNKPLVSNEMYNLLTGKKIMVFGNHDCPYGLKYTTYDKVYFTRYGKKFVCQHYPIDPKEENCDVAIVGHLHNNENPTLSPYMFENQINVSSELIGYRPMLLTPSLVESSNWLNTSKVI